MARTFLDNEMEQKCDVPAGIHDAGTKFWNGGPVVQLIKILHVAMTRDITDMFSVQIWLPSYEILQYMVKSIPSAL